MGWDFKREESKGFNTNIPEGNYRIRIKSAEKAVSKTGKDMLTLQFDVSGFAETLYHYIVFLTDRPEITNRNLTQFFDSFKDIPDGEFDTSKWIGKVGACGIKHDEYNGNTKSKVAYFISADRQKELPAWVEPEKKTKNENMAAPSGDGFMDIPDCDTDELPF